MGRRHRKTRDTTDIAKRSLRFEDDVLTPYDKERQLDFFDRLEDLRTYEDRREFNPDGQFRNARSFNDWWHRLITAPAPAPARFSTRTFKIGPPAKIGFQDPEKVLTCVRRQIRKEVMFAKRRTGRRGQKKPNWTWRSHVTCKKRR